MTQPPSPETLPEMSRDSKMREEVASILQTALWNDNSVIDQITSLFSAHLNSVLQGIKDEVYANKNPTDPLEWLNAIDNEIDGYAESLIESAADKLEKLVHSYTARQVREARIDEAAEIHKAGMDIILQRAASEIVVGGT
jgi:hypothetical protein